MHKLNTDGEGGGRQVLTESRREGAIAPSLFFDGALQPVSGLDTQVVFNEGIGNLVGGGVEHQHPGLLELHEGDLALIEQIESDSTAVGINYVVGKGVGLSVNLRIAEGDTEGEVA